MKVITCYLHINIFVLKRGFLKGISSSILMFSSYFAMDFEEFNFLISIFQAYQLAGDLGRANAERQVLECTVSAIKSTKDSSLVPILSLLCTLYFASTVDEDPTFLRS